MGLLLLLLQLRNGGRQNWRDWLGETMTNLAFEFYSVCIVVPLNECESGREIFGFYFKEKEVSDGQIEESLLIGRTEGVRPA